MRKKIWALILCCTLLLCNMSPSSAAENITGNSSTPIPTTSEEAAQLLGVGWNVGNSLDSIDYKRSGSVTHYETLWGNPVISKKLILSVKQSGFQTVRVPVSYYDHMDGNGIIDSKWMNRVEEVVNDVLDAGMYCIIDVHHDTGSGAWIKADFNDLENNRKKLVGLWEQIARRFNQYDNRLIFEGFNEILDKDNHWSTSSSDNYQAVNELNQSFVDTVRKSGGNNADRILIINGYGASCSEDSLRAIQVPNDSTEHKILVGTHIYTDDNEKINTAIDILQSKFLSRKIGVVVGECGSKADDAGKTTYIENTVRKILNAGIPCFWWDDGGEFQLFDRTSGECTKQDLVQLMINTNKTYTEISSINILGSAGAFCNDISLGDTSSYEITCSLPNESSYGNILSVSTSGNAKIFALRQEKSKLYARYGWFNEKVTAIVADKQMTIKQDGGTTYLNGKKVLSTKRQKIGDGTLKLGMTSIKIYRFKAWDRGKLIADCIPVLDENGTACLLNLVDHTVWHHTGTVQAE